MLLGDAASTYCASSTFGGLECDKSTMISECRGILNSRASRTPDFPTVYNMNSPDGLFPTKLNEPLPFPVS